NEVTTLPAGWELASAIAINNHGQIAAWADRSNLPGGHAVLLTLVSAAATGGPPVSAATTSAPPPCQLVLGFKALHDLVPSTVGNCLDDEGHNPANGDALQHTTGGLLVWRKADNWTAFTDGYHTWVNGPNGIQERLNTQRFAWEANPDHLPVVGAMSGMAPISVRQPQPYDLVDDPVHVAGVGTGFEGTFAARVRDGNGKELVRRTIPAGGTGILGNFQIDLPLGGTP